MFRRVTFLLLLMLASAEASSLGGLVRKNVSSAYDLVSAVLVVLASIAGLVMSIDIALGESRPGAARDLIVGCFMVFGASAFGQFFAHMLQ